MSEATNVERLNAAFDALTADQRRDASALLLGYVAGLVPADRWDEALEFAVGLASASEARGERIWHMIVSAS